MTPSVAIVTTLRDAAVTLESFVAYHRAIGFKRFFLFFDDPADPMLDWARTQPDITPIARDEDLQRIWRGLALWNEAAAHVEHEVMARQLLNAEHAMSLARAMGFDWLLHIDADELFYVPGGDAAAHFASLATMPAEVATYANFEAVPETEDTGDFFRTVTLFKRPLAGLPSPEAQTLMTRAGQHVDTFFHFYGNGKSAVRLAAPGMLPTNVHTFARRGECTVAWNRGPFILHYACCGFAAFWQKYVTLGRFSDKWWGKIHIADAVGPFHLQARDAVMDAVAFEDVERARRFYRDRLMIADPMLIAEMTRHDLLQRIDAPREILAALR
jgi:hypothetical protein